MKVQRICAEYVEKCLLHLSIRQIRQLTDRLTNQPTDRSTDWTNE